MAKLGSGVGVHLHCDHGYSRVTLGVSGLASVLCWLFFFLWSYVEPRPAPPFRLSIAPVQRAPVSPSHPSCGLFAYLKVAYHKVASLRVAPLRSLILLNLLVVAPQHRIFVGLSVGGRNL